MFTIDRHTVAARNQYGFTLLEMITVVSIVAVMAAMALPAFSRMVAKNEVEKAARDIASTLQTSRLLAMNQNVTVAVSPQLIPGAEGQALSVAVLNGNTGLPLTNPVTGNVISAGIQTKGTNLTSITNAGGAPLTPANFSPQGLLAPVGAPAIVWTISNVPQNIVYSVTVSPGGRVRWCGVVVPPGGVCP
ncbi:hypothetical protein YTPLAS18_34600 [Nitrospira sp.]|nr:hypothetical protein YTPLAS18_34600 [Nitrospira sp.]